MNDIKKLRTFRILAGIGSGILISITYFLIYLFIKGKDKIISDINIILILTAIFLLVGFLLGLAVRTPLVFLYGFIILVPFVIIMATTETSFCPPRKSEYQLTIDNTLICDNFKIKNIPDGQIHKGGFCKEGVLYKIKNRCITRTLFYPFTLVSSDRPDQDLIYVPLYIIFILIYFPYLFGIVGLVIDFIFISGVKWLIKLR